MYVVRKGRLEAKRLLRGLNGVDNYHTDHEKDIPLMHLERSRLAPAASKSKATPSTKTEGLII